MSGDFDSTDFFYVYIGHISTQFSVHNSHSPVLIFSLSISLK